MGNQSFSFFFGNWNFRYNHNKVQPGDAKAVWHPLSRSHGVSSGILSYNTRISEYKPYPLKFAIIRKMHKKKTPGKVPGTSYIYSVTGTTAPFHSSVIKS